MICPACGAGLKIEPTGKISIECPYCGTQIQIKGMPNVQTSEKENDHRRSEEDSKHAREIKMKRERLQIKEKEQELSHKKTRDVVVLICVIVLALFALMCIGCCCYGEAVNLTDEITEQKKSNDGMIKVGESYYEMTGENYQVVEDYLEARGFTNIETVQQEDDFYSSLYTSDSVKEVSIDGETSFDDDDYFDADAKILIIYY